MQQPDRHDLDIEFPRILIEKPENNLYFLGHPGSQIQGLFRVTSKHLGREIFPGDSKPVTVCDYLVDEEIYQTKPKSELQKCEFIFARTLSLWYLRIRPK